MLKCSIYDLFSNGSEEKDSSKVCTEEMMLSSTYYPCAVSTQLEEFAVIGIVGEVVGGALNSCRDCSCSWCSRRGVGQASWRERGAPWGRLMDGEGPDRCMWM